MAGTAVGHFSGADVDGHGEVARLKFNIDVKYFYTQDVEQRARPIGTARYLLENDCDGSVV